MRASLATGKKWGLCRLNRNDLNVGLKFLQDSTHTRHCSTCANACNEDINVLVGIAKNLFCSRTTVHGGVCRIGELGGDDGSGTGIADALSFCDSGGHSTLGVGKDQFRTKGTNKNAALKAHRGRHNNDNFVTACCTDHRECNAGISRGRFNNGSARLELSGCLCCINNGTSDTILDGRSGVESLDFCDDFRATFAQAVNSNQGSVTDEVGDICCDVGHDVS